MNEVLKHSCQIISVFAIVANIYFLYVYYRCPIQKIKSYKYFLLLTALQDLFYAACVLALVPVTISTDFAFAFIGIGPERNQPRGQICIMLFVVAFITSLLLVTNSFIYRYVHVCSSSGSVLFRIYCSAHGIAFILFVNVAIVVNWLTIIYIVFWPDHIVSKRLSGVVLELAGIDLSRTGHLCISLKLSEMTPIKIALMSELFLLMCIMGNITLYSALKINRTMKRETTSSSLKKMHRQMFILLLLQAACPLLFVHVPCGIAFTHLFLGLRTSVESLYFFAILASLFPLVCPVVIIGFLSEYRKHTLTLLRLTRKKSLTKDSVSVIGLTSNCTSLQPSSTVPTKQPYGFLNAKTKLFEQRSSY